MSTHQLRVVIIYQSYQTFYIKPICLFIESSNNNLKNLPLLSFCLENFILCNGELGYDIWWSKLKLAAVVQK